MAKDEKTDDLAAHVGAAACAAWWTLVVGFMLVAATGVVYLFVVHTRLIEAVSVVWGTGPRVVGVVFICFVGLLKLFLTLWLLGCVFLSVWARRLRGGCGA